MEWSGQQGHDALSWYLATNRHDFTFRTGLFRSFPSCTRQQPGFDAKIGQTYKMSATISKTSASYSIDGKPYASTTYGEGTVPTSGHQGFAIYGGNEHKVIDSIRIKEITNKEGAELKVTHGSRWNYSPWGGVCTLKVQPDGEIWMVRDGRGTDGSCCWKTRNGDGPKMMSSFHTMVNIFWDNRTNLKAWLNDHSTITVMHGDTAYSFKKTG